MEIVTDLEQLRLPCLPATKKEGGEVARKLVAWLERNNRRARRPLKECWNVRPRAALGLAATQLGIRKRVCVTLLGGITTVFVNPRVVGHGDVLVPFVESCLSMPDWTADTYRFPWVEVECDNWPHPVLFGRRWPERWTADSLLQAVVTQHEVGHCFGKLHIDFRTKDYPSPTTWGQSV